MLIKIKSKKNIPQYIQNGTHINDIINNIEI